MQGSLEIFSGTIGSNDVPENFRGTSCPKDVPENDVIDEVLENG